MFENSPEGVLQECKPDPEVMLQKASKQLAMLETAERLLTEFTSLPIYFDGREVDSIMYRLFGELRIKILKAKKEEKRWLDEIDK